ncbi:hypothetical protein [Desulfovermiculus halophilus]|jgi:hypothetical protein|uniref:hypothetical protein n=1 Tax=Desulfovermiculus halophilus TaxID=339722 RepID=UPI00129480C4|nr:hypothetical protein [Desulfovermiculus halophilus]
MNNEEAMKNILENAYDFLDQAIDEVKEKPKYSIIHFYTALELLMKARLMHEHWTLILTKPQDADRDNFEIGKFQSVSLKDANERLNKIVSDGLTKEELNSFNKIRDLRNKMVHFFHKDILFHDGYVYEIMKQQYVAMYYLNHIIRDRWTNVFQLYADIDFGIDQKMKKHRDYLETKYALVKEDINKLISDGNIIIKCPACLFNSMRVYEITKEDEAVYFEGECLVCSLSDSNFFSFYCEECEERIVTNEGECKCAHCLAQYTTQDLLEIIDGTKENLRIKEGGGSRAHCSECEGFETVVPFGGLYLCLQCLNSFDEEELHECEYCGSLCTTELEMSYLTGCLACDGKFGSSSFERE